MTDGPLTIACVGEAMIELSLDGDGANARVGFAGDTLNTAIYLRRLLTAGHTVDYVTALGTDAFSDRMAEYIAAEGIGTDRVTRVADRRAGLYAISTDEAGERSFAYWRENSAARTLFRGADGPDFSALEGVDVVYASAITLAILPPAMRAAFLDWVVGFRAQGGRFAFDSNYRPHLWDGREAARETTARAWREADIALPSLDDEMALFGDADEAAARARLNGYGIALGALKRGMAGPVPLGARAVEQDYPAAPSVVDTTAAGDSFNAGMLAGVLRGHPLDASLRAGHDCACRVIGHRGAIVPRDLWT